jgi:hypothetical protein
LALVSVGHLDGPPSAVLAWNGSWPDVGGVAQLPRPSDLAPRRRNGDAAINY